MEADQTVDGARELVEVVAVDDHPRVGAGPERELMDACGRKRQSVGHERLLDRPLGRALEKSPERELVVTYLLHGVLHRHPLAVGLPASPAPVASLDPAALHLQADDAFGGVGEHHVDLTDASAFIGISLEPVDRVERGPGIGKRALDGVEELSLGGVIPIGD